MKDQVLDMQMQEVGHLISDLKTFRDIIVSTLNTEVVVPDNEARLTKMKETIPAAAQKIYSDLSEDYEPTAETILHSVSDLSILIKLTDLEKRKLLESWHKYYLKLHFMLGRLKQRKEKLESQSSGSMKTRKLIFNPYTIIIILGIIVLLMFMYLSK
jgi:hypothetical protein